MTLLPLAPGQLEGALLHALRLLPVAAFSPFLGGPLVPPAVRLALGGGAGLAAFLLGGARPAMLGGAALLAAAAAELALGGALAVLVAAPLDAARAAGRLADTVRGATLAELHVAAIRQRESALGDLLVQQVVVLAAVGGGARLVLRGLLLSFAQVPAGFAVLADGRPAPAALSALALQAGAVLLSTAVAVAAPAVAGVLAADLAVSAMARLAPGLALPELAQPARTTLGLLAAAAAAGAGAGRLVALVALSAGWPVRLATGAAP